MLTAMTEKSVDAQTKRILLMPFVFLIIVAMIGLAAAYTVIIPGELAHTLSFSSLRTGSDEAAKKRVLDWMAENSAVPEQVLAKIYNAAAVTGNRDLILAICLVESNFNPNAESDKGAIGLMGIMPGVWVKELKEQGIIRERDDLYNISGNIAAGAHVLATYMSETSDLRLALIRYVGGASWYATKVLQAQKQIRLAQNADQSLPFSSLRN
ncbi:MAG: lytic transglycosylase domain-containing protein [Nitrospirae bacterium]|nr:lytic transglycosylase domain-containing protein [Nitrospirota bacterium]